MSELTEYDELADLGDALKAERDKVAALEARLSKMEEVLEQIVEWSKAYPISVFPEPDFEKAAKVLKDNGMTLDAVSASNMRHVITEVAKMAREALAGGDDASLVDANEQVHKRPAEAGEQQHGKQET